MEEHAKYLVVGTERSGSTYISSVLNNTGANFGFSDHREWNRGSGDFEHELLLDAYKSLKQFLFRKKFSDTLANKEESKLIKKLQLLYNEVDYSKYPPLCEYLPFFIKKAGFELRLIVIIRNFYDYAVSHISKNSGGDLKSCREIYLNMYQTSLINLSLFGGCIILYEDLINLNETNWAVTLDKISGIDAEKLIGERNNTSKPTEHINDVIRNTYVDAECEAIYNTYRALKENVFLPDKNKLHK